MNLNLQAGLCLITFAVINVLHEIFVRTQHIREPGIVYAAITALLFTLGVALVCRRNSSTQSK